MKCKLTIWYLLKIDLLIILAMILIVMIICGSSVVHTNYLMKSKCTNETSILFYGKNGQYAIFCKEPLDKLFIRTIGAPLNIVKCNICAAGLGQSEVTIQVDAKSYCSIIPIWENNFKSYTDYEGYKNYGYITKGYGQIVMG